MICYQSESCLCLLTVKPKVPASALTTLVLLLSTALKQNNKHIQNRNWVTYFIFKQINSGQVSHPHPRKLKPPKKQKVSRTAFAHDSDREDHEAERPDRPNHLLWQEGNLLYNQRVHVCKHLLHGCARTETSSPQKNKEEPCNPPPTQKRIKWKVKEKHYMSSFLSSEQRPSSSITHTEAFRFHLVLYHNLSGGSKMKSSSLGSDMADWGMSTTHVNSQLDLN